MKNRGAGPAAPGRLLPHAPGRLLRGPRLAAGIAWRCANSLSLRAFLGVPLDQATPDHSTLTNTRKRLPEAVFDDVFRFVLGTAGAKKLIAGTTVGVDSTRLEANAAMTSIMRRDTGDNGKQYVTTLMREAGEIGPDEEPSNEAARRSDKKRKGKKVSNEDWKSSTDADASIAHMKDGTAHQAYKAEHVVGLGERPGTDRGDSPGDGW